MEKIPTPRSVADLEKYRIELVNKIAGLKIEILEMADGHEKSQKKAQVTHYENEIRRIEDKLYFGKKAA